MFDVCDVLREARKQGASDVYLKAGENPGICIRGKFSLLEYRTVTADDVLECLLQVTDGEQRSRLEERGQCLISYEASPADRYRVAIFKSRGLVTMVFHVLLTISEVAALAEENADSIRELAAVPKGLVLFAGDAGSGRTCAMAAVAEEILQCRPVHLMTLENPVEILLGAGQALVSQREWGKDFEEYTKALEDALKERVNVLCCDGAGDENLITQWYQNCRAGLLVMASTYGNSLPEVLGNLTAGTGVGEKDEMRKLLSEMLQAVVICKWVECPKGRKQEWEVLLVDGAVRNSIRNS